MGKIKLSVVLATFNEEENLARCLDSVKGFADEVVIVDGTSKDKTVDIAKSYGAKIKVTTNPKIFHINKQKAIDMASGEWILQLDADEVVSEELAKEIQKIADSRVSNKNSTKNPRTKNQEPRTDINGYWVPRKNFFLGRFLTKGGQYPDYTIRLYRKGKGYLPQKDVHEQAVIEGKIGYLTNPLLHYPYKDFSAYLKKWDRYNHIFAGQIKDELENKSIFQKLFAGVGYLLLRPAHWLVTTYLRHKGFVDGWPGFVFSLFSALRFPVSFLIYAKIIK